MPSPSGTECGQCLRHPPWFDATHAVLHYRSPTDRLIQTLKYGSRLALAGLLGELLVNRVAGRCRATTSHCADSATVARPAIRPIHQFDQSEMPILLLPMPLHPLRLQRRGFNQAVEIGRHVAGRLDIPMALLGVSRTRDTPPQAGLPVEQRRRNMRGAFDFNGRLEGMRVAVLDDVMTTGSSLDELASVLKRAGASRVENWVVARTWPDILHV